MSDENQVTDGASIEAAIPPAVDDSTSSAPQTNGQSRPAGYEPVDPASASPEQVQDRLNYLYGQVKHSDREKKEMRGILEEQSRLISELSQGMNGVVNHLQTKTFEETETSLKAQMKAAWEKGDNDTYFALQDKLDDIRIEKKMAAKQPKEQQQPRQPQMQNATQYAEQGNLSEAEIRITDAWQNEMDERGQPLRPWAYGSDPNHRAALMEAQAVFNSPRYANLPYEKKLEEIDKRMGTPKRTSGQTVMGANLTTPGKTSKLELTPKQREIAVKTKYAGAGKTEAEHLEAYRKQIQNIKQRRQ